VRGEGELTPDQVRQVVRDDAAQIHLRQIGGNAAAQRIVRGVQLEDDPLRRLGVRLQEQGHEQVFDGRRVVADLVVARRPARRAVVAYLYTA